MARLQSKVALITGGASGIGASMAHQFAKEGATVIIADYNESGFLSQQAEFQRSGDVHFMKLDVQSEEQWGEVVRQTTQIYGQIDILVNNAGISSESSLELITPQEWQRIMNINGWGVLLGMKTVLPVMKEQKFGSVVNISSVVAVVGMGLNAYTASKGSVRALSKAAAVEYAGYNVRVNCICPGMIETPMTESLKETQETLQYLVNATPMKRLGKPEEIANGALFLASDEASFITGLEMIIDGGYAAQ